eukprot:GFYU01004939.1.p1 GENE.GFYU01004939.1~~GFYU01004939.1.p1  ORF type:complete len:539 (-),score=73.48 GFYU01004939.1:171-1787(-)
MAASIFNTALRRSLLHGQAELGRVLPSRVLSTYVQGAGGSTRPMGRALNQNVSGQGLLTINPLSGDLQSQTSRLSSNQARPPRRGGKEAAAQQNQQQQISRDREDDGGRALRPHHRRRHIGRPAKRVYGRGPAMDDPNVVYFRDRCWHVHKYPGSMMNVEEILTAWETVNNDWLAFHAIQAVTAGMRADRSPHNFARDERVGSIGDALVRVCQHLDRFDQMKMPGMLSSACISVLYAYGRGLTSDHINGIMSGMSAYLKENVDTVVRRMKENNVSSLVYTLSSVQYPDLETYDLLVQQAMTTYRSDVDGLRRWVALASSCLLANYKNEEVTRKIIDIADRHALDLTAHNISQIMYAAQRQDHAHLVSDSTVSKLYTRAVEILTAIQPQAALDPLNAAILRRNGRLERHILHELAVGFNFTDRDVGYDDGELYDLIARAWLADRKPRALTAKSHMELVLVYATRFPEKHGVLISSVCDELSTSMLYGYLTPHRKQKLVEALGGMPGADENVESFVARLRSDLRARESSDAGGATTTEES